MRPDSAQERDLCIGVAWLTVARSSPPCTGVVAHRRWQRAACNVPERRLHRHLTPVWIPPPPNAAAVMSASSIATTLLSIAFIPLIGIASASTVRVGNALGAGQARRASLAGVVVVIAILGVASIGVILSLLVAHGYVRIFTSDAATIELAILLIVHLLVMIPLAGVVFAGQSLFQACGAQWLCAQLNLVFLFAIGSPLGLLLAIPLGGGVFGLWNGNIVGSVGFTVAAGVWLYRLDWHKTAHEARLNAHLRVEREPLMEPALSESINTTSSPVNSSV